MNTQEAIRAPGADPKNATGTVRLLQQNGSIAAYLPQPPSQRKSHKQFLTRFHTSPCSTIVRHIRTRGMLMLSQEEKRGEGEGEGTHPGPTSKAHHNMAEGGHALLGVWPVGTSPVAHALYC